MKRHVSPNVSVHTQSAHSAWTKHLYFVNISKAEQNSRSRNILYIGTLCTTGHKVASFVICENQAALFVISEDHLKPYKDR